MKTFYAGFFCMTVGLEIKNTQLSGTVREVVVTAMRDAEATTVTSQATDVPVPPGYELIADGVAYCHKGSAVLKDGVAEKSDAYACCGSYGSPKVAWNDYKKGADHPINTANGMSYCVELCNQDESCKYVSRTAGGWCTLTRECDAADLKEGSYALYGKAADYRGAHGAVDNHLDISDATRTACLTPKVGHLMAITPNGKSCHDHVTTEADCPTYYEVKYRGDHRRGFGEPGLQGSGGPASGDRLDEGNTEYDASFDLVGETHVCEWNIVTGFCEAGKKVTICPEGEHVVETAQTGLGRALADPSRSGSAGSSGPRFECRLASNCPVVATITSEAENAEIVDMLDNSCSLPLYDSSAWIANNADNSAAYSNWYTGSAPTNALPYCSRIWRTDRGDAAGDHSSIVGKWWIKTSGFVPNSADCSGTDGANYPLQYTGDGTPLDTVVVCDMAASPAQ